MKRVETALILSDTFCYNC